MMLVLVFGGLDPLPAQTPFLQAASMGALLVAVVALCLGVIALARGPQRVAAAPRACRLPPVPLYFTGVGFLSVG